MAKKEGSQNAVASEEKKALPVVSNGKEVTKQAAEDLDAPIDFDAILAEYDPANLEKKQEEERKKQAEARRQEDELHREEREILEKIYNVKPEGTDSYDDDEVRPVEDEEAWKEIGRDKEGWTEGDLDEEWIDPPDNATNMFYDPHLGITGIESDAGEDDDDRQRTSRFRRRRGKKRAKKQIPKEIRTPEAYVPFRRPLPPIPDDDDAIIGAEGVLRELEMEEEFLDWDSYVFQDGSTYEGTSWNDLAQGKGVYTTALDLCKYEGEWVQNAFQGHGVLTVDIPKRVPAPDSKLAAKEGEAFEDKFLAPEEREWLKMELEDLDATAQARQKYSSVEEMPNHLKVSPYDQKVSFEDHPFWKKLYGRAPPKGRYKYAGEMKQNRMHGCGVYELNGRMIWGKWYFGELLADPAECDAETSGFHAAMAEVAASKARMFTNKPDGMVREVRGPYTDPSHPYMYEDEDMWMAPGFINEFHPVPTTWKKYADEVDSERESWLNSFTQAPLRIPMPPELSHIWEKEDEFVVLGNTPNREGRLTAEDKIMSRKDMQGKVLLHVPSRQIINWAEDKDGHLRFFIQPYAPGEKFDPATIQPLPLGFKEFMEDKPMEEEEEEEVDGEPKTVAQKLQEIERKRKRRQQQWAKEDALRKAKLEAKGEAIKGKVQEAQDQEMSERITRQEEIAKELELQDETFRERLKALAAQAESILSGEEEEAEGGEEEEEDSEPQEEEIQVVEEERPDAGKADEEEDEEEEEDKKPRSFGKVAFADNEAMREELAQRKKGSSGPPLPFPTVFASLSITSQIGFHQMMQKTARALAGLQLPWKSQHCLNPKSGSLEAPTIVAASQSSLGPVKATQSEPEAFVVESLVRARRGPTLSVSVPASFRNSSNAIRSLANTRNMKGRNLNGSIIPKHVRVRSQNIGNRSQLNGTRIRKVPIAASAVGIFAKPHLDCLSLAVPVAQE